MRHRGFIAAANGRLFGRPQSADESGDSRAKNTKGTIMRSIRNKKEKESQACDRELKPSQIAPDEDGTIVREGAEVSRKIGHSAAAVASGQMLKPGAPFEQDVETAL